MLKVKKQFVEVHLKAMVVAANDYYVDVSYGTEGYEEYVYVHCKDGHEIRICVTADSLMSIVRDVVRKLD